MPNIARLLAGVFRGKKVRPSSLTSPDRKVTWHNGTLWRLPIHINLSNLWFWASRVTPMYRARRMNATRIMNPVLPPLDSGDLIYVPMKEEDFSGEWMQAVLRLASGGKASVVYGDSDGSWGKQWNDKNWICFKHVVGTGTYGGVVSVHMVLFGAGGVNHHVS